SAATARRNVRRMARQFIAGATPDTALPQLERLWRAGEASTVDLLGGHIVTEAEADRYAGRVSAMLEALVSATRGSPEAPLRRRRRSPEGPETRCPAPAQRNDAPPPHRAAVRSPPQAPPPPPQDPPGKGAFPDSQTIGPAGGGRPGPVFETKPETDANYERCV